jgi:hypothetical protein
MSKVFFFFILFRQKGVNFLLYYQIINKIKVNSQTQFPQQEFLHSELFKFSTIKNKPKHPTDLYKVIYRLFMC